ncbi:MAG: YihY family inner membrane protein [Noviherbaspirillum sp.]
MPSNDHSLLAGFSNVQVRDLLRFAGQRLREERLPQVAGSLTFTTVLALVPLLTIALAVFTTFPLFDTFRNALNSYFLRSLIPTGIASTILEYLNQFASQATQLSAVGAVVLVTTAVAMIGTVDRTFNRIWRVRTRRPFAQRVLTYWAVITLGPLLIGVSISVTGYLFAATDGVVIKVPLLGSILFTLVSLALTSGAFTLLYMVVPNRLIDWRDAACGGVLAAIAFELSKRLFAVFIASFPTYTILYGALAAVPLFLVWIYLGWLITLMGATLTAALPVVRYERWWHVAWPGSAFIDALSLLEVLYQARGLESAAVSAATLRLRTRIGFEESERLLQQMLDAGWVGRIQYETPRRRVQLGKRYTVGLDSWTLLANPGQLRLADVYRMFVFTAGEQQPLAEAVEAAVEQGLQQTLADYFHHHGQPQPA